jgi:putative oxidoreductase
LLLGFGFIAHGYAKLARGPEHFGTILDAIGVPFSHFTAWLTTLTEIVGGVAVAAGFAVELVTVPLAIVMVTAMVTVHWPNGFSTIKLQGVGPAGARFGSPGYELNLVYIVGLVALALSPPTRLSIDRWRARP